MSEYQYYEFLAVDRPLTEAQMGKLRTISSRAEITPTRFSNFYTFGDFKGNPARMVEEYFDAFLYVANWGTHLFTLRLPRQALSLECAKCYCLGKSASARTKHEFVILDFSSRDEEGDWEEDGGGWLSSLIPLRADLANGDYRALYLAWLLGVQCEELDDEETEPLCPPGLNELSAPLKAFGDFLRIDPDLVKAAAAASPALVELSLGAEFERWVAELPEPEKAALLVQVAKEAKATARGHLLRRYRDEVAPAAASRELARPRTAAELRALAEKHRDDRLRKQAQRATQERARREREAAVARSRYLDDLAQRESETWGLIDTLIATKRPRDYDQAVQLLKDLCDLGERSGRSTEVKARILEIRARHPSKQSFLRRLGQSGLILP